MPPASSQRSASPAGRAGRGRVGMPPTASQRTAHLPDEPAGVEIRRILVKNLETALLWFGPPGRNTQEGINNPNKKTRQHGRVPTVRGLRTSFKLPSGRRSRPPNVRATQRSFDSAPL